jgi:triosephosphate isomerase
MRTPLIAGNWKMNTTVAEARILTGQMTAALSRIKGAEIVLCPPFISLTTVKDVIQGTPIQLGAQNMYFEEKGAFTGEISPRMLASLCGYVILGHSERRHIFSESDELIACKIQAAIRAHLKPILCVGELPEDNESGLTEAVIERQLKTALNGIGNPDHLAVAYEPVWAIGTGRAATAKQANDTAVFIRDTIANLFGNEAAESIRILYGGSVTSTNVSEFVGNSDIDGTLVGGASLKPYDFISIADQTAALKRGG